MNSCMLLRLGLALATLVLLPACGSESGPAAVGVSAGAGTCVDADGDGFFVDCAASLDCDDADAGVTNECYWCDEDRPGCRCDTEGARAACGSTQEVQIDGILCGAGEMLCDGGQWGECVLNNSVYKLSPDHPNHQIATASPSSCVDACDPYCTHWNDLPGDDDIADSGTGIIADDSGVSLEAGGAVSTTSVCSGGVSGTCTHHLCDDGAALTTGCDNANTCVADGAACDGSSPCCYGLTCQSGVCVGPPTRAVLFEDDFDSGNTKGWSLSGEWELDTTAASSGHEFGYPDPSEDTTDGSANGVLGTNVGGNIYPYTTGYNYAYSPIIDTAGASGTMTLEYNRMVNLDYSPYQLGEFYIYASGTWTRLEYITGGQSDSGWSTQTIDITDYKSSDMRIAIGYYNGSYSSYYAYYTSGWNIDDFEITADGSPASCSATGGACDSETPCCNDAYCDSGVCTPADSCVQQVCDARPECCTDAWDTTCVALVDTECSLSCGIDPDNMCVACYEDALDHDGDGFSFLDGDCSDCDPNMNPGALDFPDNGIDEDCSGTADDAVLNCDTGLTFASTDPMAYAQAMDLCQTTSAVTDNWGVISAELVQADGVTPCGSTLQHAIMTRFGDNNVPLLGDSMAVLSSGTARDSADAGYVDPNGQVSSYSVGTYATPPDGFPQNAAGCPTGAAAYDSCSLKLTVRAPTNAQSFAYSFNFFTTEYPEWVCNEFNDSFIAVYDGTTNTTSNGNISFDSNGDPVSVNIGFFSVPGSDTATTHDVLDGTGFDGYCTNTGYPAYYSTDGACGGATDWLTTTAPVVGGEEIEILLSIWDTGDTYWDSTVLLDNFVWSESPATISTLPAATTTPDLYEAGEFLRVYDYDSACPDNNTASNWGYWSWTASTPDDSSIEFYIKTATTEAGLSTATEVPLTFTTIPGPASVDGNNAVAQASPVDTQSGSVDVGEALLEAGVKAERFIQIRSLLQPSGDQLSAPTLQVWDQQASCVPQD